MGKQLARFSDIRLSLIVGGLSVKLQEAELRTRPDIVLATPGRLIDLLRNALGTSLDELEILVRLRLRVRVRDRVRVRIS